MSRSVVSLVVKLVLSKWVKKFDASTLEVDVKKKTLVLRNFDINTSTLLSKVPLPDHFRYESARCTFLKMTFEKWPTTAENMTKRIINASFGILSIDIVWISPLEVHSREKPTRRSRRSRGTTTGAKNRTPSLPTTPADDRFQRKLFRAIQLEARSVRINILLPGGLQSNININGWEFFSTNSMGQRIYTLKHMFDVKHFKLLRLASTELRFGWGNWGKMHRRPVDEDDSIPQDFGVFYEHPVEVRTTTEYVFDSNVDWTAQRPSLLDVNIRFAMRFHTFASKLRSIVSWLSTAQTLVSASLTGASHQRTVASDGGRGSTPPIPTTSSSCPSASSLFGDSYVGEAIRRSPSCFGNAKQVRLRVEVATWDTAVSLSQDRSDSSNSSSQSTDAPTPKIRVVSSTPSVLAMEWSPSEVGIEPTKRATTSIAAGLTSTSSSATSSSSSPTLACRPMLSTAKLSVRSASVIADIEVGGGVVADEAPKGSGKEEDSNDVRRSSRPCQIRSELLYVSDFVVRAHFVEPSTAKGGGDDEDEEDEEGRGEEVNSSMKIRRRREKKRGKEKTAATSATSIQRSQGEIRPGCVCSCSMTGFKLSLASFPATHRVLVPIIKHVLSCSPVRDSLRIVFGSIFQDRPEGEPNASMYRSAALAHVVLFSLRRIRAHIDVSATDVLIELPSNVLIGEFNRSKTYAHASDITVLRIRGKGVTVSNWFCVDSDPWRRSVVREVAQKLVATCAVLPIAMESRRCLFTERRNPSRTNPRWPALVCFGCRFGSIHGADAKNRRVFEYTANRFAFATSVSKATCVGETTDISGSEESSSSPSSPPTPLARPIVSLCATFESWKAIVPPSQTSDFFKFSYAHMRQLLHMCVGLGREIVPGDAAFVDGPNPGDIYALSMWQQIVGGLSGIPLAAYVCRKSSDDGDVQDGGAETLVLPLRRVDMFVSVSGGRGNFCLRSPFLPMDFNIAPFGACSHTFERCSSDGKFAAAVNDCDKEEIEFAVSEVMSRMLLSLERETTIHEVAKTKISAWKSARRWLSASKRRDRKQQCEDAEVSFFNEKVKTLKKKKSWIRRLFSRKKKKGTKSLRRRRSSSDDRVGVSDVVGEYDDGDDDVRSSDAVVAAVVEATSSFSAAVSASVTSSPPRDVPIRRDAGSPKNRTSSVSQEMPAMPPWEYRKMMMSFDKESAQLPGDALHLGTLALLLALWNRRNDRGGTALPAITKERGAKLGDRRSVVGFGPRFSITFDRIPRWLLCRALRACQGTSDVDGDEKVGTTTTESEAEQRVVKLLHLLFDSDNVCDEGGLAGFARSSGLMRVLNSDAGDVQDRSRRALDALFGVPQAAWTEPVLRGLVDCSESSRSFAKFGGPGV